MEQCGISAKEAQLAALSAYEESAINAEKMKAFSSIDRKIIAYFCAALFAGDEEDWFMDEESETMLNKLVVAIVGYERADLPCKFLARFCDLHGEAGNNYPKEADNVAIHFCETMLSQMHAMKKIFPFINYVDIQ